MTENWKSIAIGIVIVLSAAGFFKIFFPSPEPHSPEPSLVVKPAQVTEKIGLRVRSEEKTPVQDVTVEFAASSGSSSTKLTDSGGYAEVVIPKSVDVVVFLKHKDYASQSHTINSDVDSGKTREFILKGKTKADLPFTPASPVSKPEPINPVRVEGPILVESPILNAPPRVQSSPSPKPLKPPIQINPSPPYSEIPNVGDPNKGSQPISQGMEQSCGAQVVGNGNNVSTVCKKTIVNGDLD